MFRQISNEIRKRRREGVEGRDNFQGAARGQNRPEGKFVGRAVFAGSKPINRRQLPWKIRNLTLAHFDDASSAKLWDFPLPPPHSLSLSLSFNCQRRNKNTFSRAGRRSRRKSENRVDVETETRHREEGGRRARARKRDGTERMGRTRLPSTSGRRWERRRRRRRAS